MERISGLRASRLALLFGCLSGCAGKAQPESSDAGEPHRVGASVEPFTVNGVSVGASPNLVFPGCDGGAYGPTDASGDASLGCVQAGATTSVTGTGLWYSASGALNAAAVTPTGDITAMGALSGSNLPFTIGKINGIGITGTPAAGNQPIASSTTTSAWGALNLAGGSNYVTGSLPAGNQANQTMAGDVTGTTGANTVVQITGSSSVANVISGTALDFLTTGHPTSTNGRINFQGDLGSKQVLIGARNYLNTGDEEILSNNSGLIVFMGACNVNDQVVYSGPNGNGATVSSAGWSWNATRAKFISTPVLLDSASNLTVGSTTADYGGGQGLLDFATVTTFPTALPASDASLYCSGTNALTLNGQTFNFSKFATTATIGEGSISTQTQGNNLTLKPQQSTQATNEGSGNVIAALQAPIGTGTEAWLEANRGSTLYFATGGVPTVGSTQSGIWLLPNAPTLTNYVMDSDGSSTVLNAPSASGNIYTAIGGTTQNDQTVAGLELFAGSVDFGGGTQILSIGPTSQRPTGAASTSIGLYNDTGQLLGINATGIRFDNTISAQVVFNGLAAASTSAGSGAAGQQFQYATQAGQPATGASNNGGAAGGVLVFGGNGGSSGSATGGVGGNTEIRGGAGGNGTTGGAGGDVMVNSGAVGTGGTPNTGTLHLRLAGTDIIALAGGTSAATNAGTGLGLVSTTYTIGNTTGNNTPTYAVTQFPIIQINTVTIGSGCILTLPNVANGYWFIDISKLTLTNAITIKSGSGTCGSAISALNTTDQMVEVVTYGSNTCTLNQ